jgi:outer membrane protein assembly factor BamE (lipoprotein component of BamABCDE complex)
VTPDTRNAAVAPVNAASCRVPHSCVTGRVCPAPQEDDPAVPKLPTHCFAACLFAGMLAATTLAGCTPPGFISYPPQVRGNKVDARVLAQLVPGTSTRADVTALLGSPTMHATFDDNTWLYIGEVTKPQIGGTNEVLNQQVVVLTFDQQGVLRDIANKSQQDSVPVEVVSRTTPAPGKELSFWQQLIGNVGKFTPVQAEGASGGMPGGPPK